MTGSAVGDRPIRLATIPVVLCVLLYCIYRITGYLPWPEVNYDPGINRGEFALITCVILALGAVQIQFALRRPSRRGACVLLAVQVVLAFGPYLLLGGRWEAPAAFVVAAVLLTFAGWWSWALAALAAVGYTTVWIATLPGVVYIADRGTTLAVMYTALAATANGLLLFGMTRLSELVRDLHRTRSALAPLEVARERLRIARSLQDAVGRRLASIVSACQRADGAPGRDGENAQAVMAEARQAVAEVRTVTDDYRDRSLAAEIEGVRTVLAAAEVEVVADAVPDGLPAPVDAVLAAVLRRTVVAALRGTPPRSCRIELDGSARMRVSFTGGAAVALASEGIADEVAKVGGRLRNGPEGGVTGGIDVEIPVQPHRSPAPRTPRPVSAAPWLAWGIIAVLEVDMLITTLARARGSWDFIDPLSPQRTAVVIAMAVPLSLLQLHHVRPRSGRVPPGWRWTLSLQIVLLGVGIAIGGSAFPGHVYGGAVAGVVLFHLGRPWSWVLSGGLLVSAGLIEAGNFGLSLTTGLPISLSWEIYAMIAVATLCRLPVAAEQLIAARQELARLAVVRERLRIARDTHDLLGFQLSAIAVKAGLAARLAATDAGTASTHLNEAGQVAEQALNSLRAITGEPIGLSFAAEVDGARSMLSAAGIAVAVELHAMPEPAVESTLAIVLREAVTNVVRHSRATTCRIETSPVPGGIRLRVTNDGVASAAAEAPSGNGLANLRARAREAGGQLTTDLRGDEFTLVAEVRSEPAGLGGDPDRIDPVAGVQLGDRRSEVVAHRAV